MMNRINELFRTKKKDVLSVYFCAGHPAGSDASGVIESLAGAGVDMIEIGIPFSDPMADGPVIQQATRCALQGGMTLKKLFGQLDGIRNRVQIPLLMMGYLNPIMQYGFENFCRSCSECGVDGAIIPDLPLENYIEEYLPVARKYDIRMIMLITPETSPERIRLIDRYTDGFIYMVSAASVTGFRQFGVREEEYFRRIAQMGLKNPLMIGFGISDKQSYETAAAHACGAIIGSKYVRLLEESGGDAHAAAVALLKAIGRTEEE